VNCEMARKVADAVMYEGYMLYPYRPSAIKNRQRWTFGILYPPGYGEVQQGTERAGLHSECLARASGGASIHIQLRFLHLLERQVTKAVENGDGFDPVPSLVVDGERIESWDEGIERSVECEIVLQDGQTRKVEFSFPDSLEGEELRDSSGQVVGNVTRTQHEVRGTVTVLSQELRDGIWKLTIDFVNETEVLTQNADRDQALLRSLLSAHAIVTISGGEFVSLLDPPAELCELVSTCRNIGNFPVLVGADGERDMVLCSPIVLYDYPQIAPESAGDFYDSTEIDEMLTLRVMTLTEDEKSEMRRADDHVRSLLQRTEETAREQLARTHGAIRSMRPVNEKP
jgi:hypothetical protein